MADIFVSVLFWSGCSVLRAQKTDNNLISIPGLRIKLSRIAQALARKPNNKIKVCSCLQLSGYFPEYFQQIT